LVGLDEVLSRDDDIEDDLDVIFSNPIASTIPKWRTFKLKRRLVDLDETLWGDEDIEDDLDAIFCNPVASFQHGGRSNFRGGCNNFTIQPCSPVAYNK
jgi:hypothetical protein